jgi:adenylate kinase family enzyme
VKKFLTPRLEKSIIEKRKMLITSERNKAAWNIRRRLAKQRNCKLLDISWKECLATVEAALEKVITRVTDYMLKSKKDATFKDRLKTYKSLWAKESEYLKCRLAGMDVLESIKRVWFGLTETVRMHY